MKRRGEDLSAAVTPKKIDRKTIEKNRRIKMKGLCYDLVSIIPSPYFDSKEMFETTQLDQLEQATNYIVNLRERVQHLKEKKAKLAMLNTEETTQDYNTRMNDAITATDLQYPIMELRDLGSCLELIVISKLQKSFMLFDVIRVIEEEGTEVVGVNVFTNGNKVYHTLHVEVRCPRVGVETSRIGGRLHELISAVETPNFVYHQIDYECSTNTNALILE